MTTGSSATIPAHTVLGLRAQNERLGFQEFHLVLVNTDGVGKSFAITDSSLKIGKAPDNDVVIDQPTVSRNHLVIQRQGDRFLVQDLQSTNGTFIDGAQIREAYLKPGQLLELGDVQLRFQSTAQPRCASRPSVEDRLGELVGKSVPMRQIFALLKRISSTDSTLLLVGETGSGKGAAAKAIHQLSPRHDGPLVVFDCAAVSDSLIESELFGHEKGAFTGAVNQRLGCLERAHGGTLFLDEIDDLALDLQPKLLRAHRGPRVPPPGREQLAHRLRLPHRRRQRRRTSGPRPRPAAFARTSTSGSRCSPSACRRCAIARRTSRCWWTPSPASRCGSGCPTPVREQFLAHAWPGNVRELRNALERARHMVDIPELSSGSLLREFARDVPAGGDILPASYAGPFKECKEELVAAVRARVPDPAPGPLQGQRRQGRARGGAGPEAPLLAPAQVRPRPVRAGVSRRRPPAPRARWTPSDLLIRPLDTRPRPRRGAIGLRSAWLAGSVALVALVAGVAWQTQLRRPQARLVDVGPRVVSNQTGQPVALYGENFRQGMKLRLAAPFDRTVPMTVVDAGHAYARLPADLTLPPETAQVTIALSIDGQRARAEVGLTVVNDAGFAD